jgi:predicted dehydrogenase
VCAEGGWLLSQGFNMSYTLQCERATLDFDLSRGAGAMRVIEAGKPANVITYEGPDGYGEEIRYVVECAATGRRPSTVTVQDGLTALEICEAEEKSLKTGTIVSM